MSAEKHIFHTTASQVDIGWPALEGRAVVRLRLFKQSRIWLDTPEDFTQDGEPTLVAEQALRLPHGRFIMKFIAEHLLRMGVPAEEHDHIVHKFLQRLLVSTGVDDLGHEVPYTVNILDISVSLLGRATYREIVDWVARQPIVFEDHRGLKFIPASRCWINSLKKVRIDTLEVMDIGSCAICLNDSAECTDQLVITLPCKHLYHAECIVKSLEISHLCPLCRHPMPVEADEQ